MEFIDFFSGIGGFRRGMELAGHKCVGFCEYDKFAVASYTAMHLLTNEQREYMNNIPSPPKKNGEPNLHKRQQEILKEEYRNGEWYANDVRTIDAERLPRADCWCFGFPCFEAGTLIMTECGYKRIEHIKKGDMVLTHRQRFRPVVTPMKHKTEEIYELDVFGVDRLCATGEHPFLVKDGNFAVWKKTEELIPGDMIAVSVNQEERLPEWNGITFKRHGREYRLNNLNMEGTDFWWFVGCYMGDGWCRVTSRKNASDNYRVVVACNEEKLERLKAHVNGMFHYNVVKERTAYKVHFVNKELTMFLTQFGKGAEEKHLTDAVLNLPVKLLQAFLQGYFETDGCKIGKYHQASTISKELAYGIQACVHKVYHRPCAVYRNEMPKTCMIEGRTVRQRDFYIVRFKEEYSEKDSSFLMNGYIWSRFKRRQKVSFDGYVYNMEVEDDNSYTAYNLAVHNCQDISIAGKQKGFKGNRSSLFFAVTRLLRAIEEESKPSYLLIENVKNLLSVNRGYDFARLLTELDEIGYDAEWDVLNSKNFGVPQNRERVFIVGHLRGRCTRKVFPIGRTSEENSLSLNLMACIDGRNSQRDRIYSIDGLAPTCSTCPGGNTEPKIGIPVSVLNNVFLSPDVTCINITDKTGKERPQQDRIYGVDGVMTALSSQLGGRHNIGYPVSMTRKSCKETDIANTLTAGTPDKKRGNYSPVTGVAIPVLTPDRENKRQNGRRMKENGEPMFTLTSQDRHGVGIQIYDMYNKTIRSDGLCGTLTGNGNTSTTHCGSFGIMVPISGNKSDSKGIVVKTSDEFDIYAIWYEKYQCYIVIRKLTPRECFRLQGWVDEYFDRAEMVNSDSQLYKQAGNGVTVNVVQAIAERMQIE